MNPLSLSQWVVFCFGKVFHMAMRLILPYFFMPFGKLVNHCLAITLSTIILIHSLHIFSFNLIPSLLLLFPIASSGPVHTSPPSSLPLSISLFLFPLLSVFLQVLMNTVYELMFGYLVAQITQVNHVTEDVSH